MRPVERIALAEFVRSFGFKSGAPGGRDFFSLSIFFWLACFMLFLGVAAKEGTRHRFEQVLLGALPASGPPIQLNTHIDRLEGLTPAVLAKLADDHPHLNVPVRDFDGQSGVLFVPGFDIYQFKPQEDKPQNQSRPASASAETPPQAGTDGKADIAANERRECDRLKKANFAWQCSPSGDLVRFRGLALARTSPIWRWAEGKNRQAAGEGPEQLVVVASRAMFQKHFRYERYWRDVTESIEVPCAIRQDVHAAPPARFPNSVDFPTIVLRMKEGVRSPDTYHVARVIWVDSLPVNGVAMVVPLESYEKLLASEGRLGVSVHPETWRSSRRIVKITFFDFDRVSPSERESIRPAFREFAACLGARENDTPLVSRGREPVCGVIQQATDLPKNADPVLKVPRLVMENQDASLEVDENHGLRVPEVAKCAARAGLAAYFGPDRTKPNLEVGLQREAATPVNWKGPAVVELPCSAVGNSVSVGNDGVVNDPLTKGNSDTRTCEGMTHALLAGFREAFIYVGRGDVRDAGGQPRADDSSGLDTIVQRLLNWRHDGRPVFRLDPGYEGALVRFGVLSTLLERIAMPLSLGALVMYLFLAAVILMTTFAHRRPQYGLLLMNGMRSSQVVWMVLCQIVMAAVFGGVWGFLSFALVRGEINASLADSAVIRRARDLIGLDIPIFIELPSVGTFLLAWAWLTALTALVGIIVLTAQGVTRARAPIMLLKA